MRYVLDIETDGINATKIHCLAYRTEDNSAHGVLYDYDKMKDLVNTATVIIGHNIIRYDIPILCKLLNINIHARLIDTLALSWTLYPDRLKHGLEGWGEEFNVPKPKIVDWQNLTKEEYGHRCSEDVRINYALWHKQKRYLEALYSDTDAMNNYIDYLSFKLDCVKEQEQIGIAFDEELCTNTLIELESERESKLEILRKAMPKIPITVKKSCPKVLYKANGELSSRGKEWFDLLKTMNLPPHTPEVEITKDYEEGNPNSHEQVKDWLYTLGWIPENIKHVRDKKKGTVRKIPQIASAKGGGEICESILKLADKEPSLLELNGLSVINHRIGLLKGFLRDQVGGRLYPTTTGLTNTLRLQHGIVVNLPSVERKYGKEIRGCLIADENSELCGSDLSGIEDSTKRHYIYKYDPDYVEEMNRPDFDPHLDIAMLVKWLSPEQVLAHKEGKENHSSVRRKAKIVNFSATYKVGAETLARNSGFSVKEAKQTLKVYWERNHAILKVEQELDVKIVNGQRWLRNPVSGFWYSLRAEKDRFSTLNQGTAVYVFDVWVMYLRNLGIRIALQYHDEVLFNVHKDSKEYVKRKINEAIQMVNDRLKLNVTVGCSVQFGQKYSDCH